MLDWARIKLATREIRRNKRTKAEMEREAMWQLKEQALRDVIKAKAMESGAYRKALETFVSLEDENLLSRQEKPTSGDYHEILMSIVEQYAPPIARGAIKGAILKRKEKINEAAEKFINERIENAVKEREERGEIKRLSPEVRKELK